MATVHVVGAGIAGLACAVQLAAAGCAVAVHEAAPQAGGRCRSFEDRALGCRLDNGNHLLLSANQGALGFLQTIGAADTLVGPPRAAFPFLDLRTGERWSLRPNAGWLPWWVLAPGRRVPGTRASDYLSGLALATARRGHTVADRVGADHPLYERLWEPLTLAAMNAAPAVAAAAPMSAVLRATFGRGEGRCRPLIARDGLSASFIDPALDYLRARDVSVRLGRRLRSLDLDGNRVTGLDFADGRIPLKASDTLVLAIPPSAVRPLLPGVTGPDEGLPIVNGHFRLSGPAALPDGDSFLGLIGGTAHWVFPRGDVASVTVSGAVGLVDEPPATIAERLWRDIALALGRPEKPVPPYRIVKERRATFTQTPEQLDRRPSTRTRWTNCLLAGDWTDTGLPATIEGAARSGQAAAAVAQEQQSFKQPDKAASKPWVYRAS